MRFLVQRTLRSLLTLWLVVSIVFVVFRLVGDPLDVLLPESTPPAIRAYYAERWGLDQPVYAQYFRYFVSLAQGDLGYSFLSGRAVSDIILHELPNTVLLGGSAFLLAMLLGVGAGMIAAVKHNTLTDRIIMFSATAGFSLPNYFMGTALIIVFAVGLRWLPTSGNDSWRHLILPLVTLGTASAARVARFTRGALLDTLGEAYLQTARSKGLGERRIWTAHAFRNAAIPIATVLGTQLGYLVGGAAIVETVFAWPGIGRLMVDAVAIRDLAVVQALVLLIATSVTFTNFMTDVVYTLLDPRVRVIQ